MWFPAPPVSFRAPRSPRPAGFDSPKASPRESEIVRELAGAAAVPPC